MTLELRPQGLDATYRPGSGYTINLNGPAGWLTSRTFTASFAGEALSAGVEVGDTVSFTVTSVLTTANPSTPAALVITETGGNAELVGVWTPSMRAASGLFSNDVEVTLGDIEVEVTLGGLPPVLIDGGAP